MIGYGVLLFLFWLERLFFHFDGLYWTIFSGLFTGLQCILRNLIHFDTGLVIIHFKNFWASLCAKPTSDTGFFVHDRFHPLFSFPFLSFNYYSQSLF